MKKIIATLLVFILVLSFFGCSKNSTLQENTTNKTDTAETSETKSRTVTVTFPEGMTVAEIAEKLEKNEVCSAEDFIRGCEDIEYFKENYEYDFLDDINVNDSAYKLEGFIFPDTYEFYRGESAKSAINRFLSNFNKKFTDDMKKKAKEMGFTVSEVVILASIIQDECSYVNEMPNVSSVFVNRINSPSYGKLQSDVTINYVNNYITDMDYVLDKDSKDYAALYNTYKCEGLPAGAVCCPGIEAINAALNPAETDYYFFVTDADMNYYYANTYEKHLENCKICGY